jgi:hypothetical protein
MRTRKAENDEDVIFRVEQGRDELGIYYELFDSKGEVLPFKFSTFERAEALREELNAAHAAAQEE